MRILRIHHVTVAVRDVDAARATFASLLGAAEAGAPDKIAAFAARTQELALGDALLQLAAPLEHDSALQRFIERRGEGVYTIALEVDGLDAAIAELTAAGVRVSAPVEATPGLRSAFVSMAATHGVSVQLVEPTARTKAAPVVVEPPPDAEATAEAEAPAPLDLTPDEWSDID